MRGSALILILSAIAAPAAAQQREADGYTRYELLAPATHKFRVVYEITAATPDATAYFNPIRPGSVATDERVTDRATGRPLKFDEVDGNVAQAGGIRSAQPGSRWIRVTLARPVPADGGGGRVLIDKTYEDAKSYFADGGDIVFDRPLGVKRNAVVLPPGYELVACNYPAQVLQEADGRIKIAFWNVTPAEAPLKLRARPAKLVVAPSSMARSLTERAAQSRNIVYYLQPPETHAFDLTHDYTETKPGTDRYVNEVRAGSTVSNPSARDLDTGAALSVETTPAAVTFRYPALKAGESRRLRIRETYTDPERYRVEAGELVWHRSFGRADNAVVLPAGWALTNSSIPAAVSQLPDGRVRLDYLNPRADEIDVVITARRRAAA